MELIEWSCSKNLDYKVKSLTKDNLVTGVPFDVPKYAPFRIFDEGAQGFHKTETQELSNSCQKGKMSAKGSVQ